MPPRKRGRQSSAGAPSPAEPDEKKGGAGVKHAADGSDHWTDEEEALLFKSMISWKPVGLHKHFRMIAISENLQAHGLSAQDRHTSPAGIWAKLEKLYNLEALDERENEVEDSASVGDDQDDEDANEAFYDFVLPERDFWDLSFARRNAFERPSSPAIFPYQLHHDMSLPRRRQSTIDDTDEPRSSPLPGRGGRAGRGRGRRSQAAADSFSFERTEEDDGPSGDHDGDETKSTKAGGAGTRRSGRRR